MSKWLVTYMSYTGNIYDLSDTSNKKSNMVIICENEYPTEKELRDYCMHGNQVILFMQRLHD